MTDKMKRVSAASSFVRAVGLSFSLIGASIARAEISTTLTLTASRDTSIAQASPASSEGATDRLYMYVNDGNGLTNRALVGFPDLPTSFNGGFVVSAIARVELARSFGAVVDVRALTHDWVEGGTGVGISAANWNTYDGVNAWPGGPGAMGDAGGPEDFWATDTKTLPFLGATTSGTFINFDVTSTAQRWVNGTLPNYGVLFQERDGAAGTTSRFFSREATDGAAPQLIIKVRPADFGQQWERQNPFQLMAAVSGGAEFDVDQYQNAGLNVVFANASAPAAQNAADAGVPWQVHASAGFQFFEDSFSAITPGPVGVLAYDEPLTEADIAEAAARVRQFHGTYPELLTYVDALPSYYFPTAQYTYDEYLDEIVHVVKSDILQFDMYPLNSDGTTERNEWFNTLMAVRNKALANNIPYSGWLQAFKAPSVRTPSESDTRWNAFTLLTAGYTSLNYYAYDRYGIPEPPAAGTFFDGNGNPTAFYHHAAASNAEVANLGRSLRMLSSTAVQFVPGSNATTPPGLTNWSAATDGDPHLTSVAVDTANPANQGVDKDGLIGFFEDDDGEPYFMLTNMYHGGSLSAQDASLSFLLGFDNTVNSIWLLNRTSGLAEEIALTNHMLNWTLPGGTGDLFKYDNGNFAVALPSAWVLNGSGDWNVSSNWGQGLPNDIGAIANFTSAITAPRTVFTNAAITVGTINFDNANSYQISGQGSLTLKAVSGAALVNVVQGTHKINLPLTIASNTVLQVANAATLKISDPVTVNAGKSLSQSGSGTVTYESTVTLLTGASISFSSPAQLQALSMGASSLAAMNTGENQAVKIDSLSVNSTSRIDVKDSALIVANSDLGQITGLIKSGRNGGAWNSNGITTSMTAAASGLTTLAVATAGDLGKTSFRDLPVSAEDVLVMYTYGGDANLSGNIDADDYFQIDSNYGKAANASKTYFNGDFNYDGLINSDDYFVIDQSFSGQGVPFSQGASISNVSAVPEPASIALLALGAGAMFRRRHSGNSVKVF